MKRFICGLLAFGLAVSLAGCESSALAGDMEVPEQAPENRVDGQEVFLRLPSAEGKPFRHLQLLLQMFPGEIPVKVRMQDTGKLLGTTCMLHASLVRELKAYYGEENVVIR